MTPQVEAVVKASDKLALCKVDIKKWDSPVSRQFALKSLPHLKVYSPTGELVKEGGREVFDYIKTIK